MKIRLLALIAAFATLSASYFIGVSYFYGPIAEADTPGEPLLPMAAAFFVSILLYVLLFAWLSEQTRSPIKAALAIAIAQLLLVDVDYVLSGDRGVAAGGASALLLLVSWGLVGLVYQGLSRGPRHTPIQESRADTRSD